ncbi:MAG: FAD-dependent oxidoreductase, partial [Desulfobacterales bacterium]|nr:FAD-dependent oxidoreductase [Desulfobacterales bacterium]
MSDNTVNAWRCGVCGFVHRDSEPPPECPVCGAPGEGFEAYAEVEPAETPSRPDQWRCLVCTYTHRGERPPEQCPVCGTPAKKFEAVVGGAQKTVSDSGAPEEMIVVGGGAAGIAAVESMRRTSANARITLLTKEPHAPYYRLNLTRLLAGEIAETVLPVHPESWYRENRIDLALGAEVSALFPDQGRIGLKSGEKMAYDKLVLTAGAHPFTPPIPGVRMEGVTTLRSLDDARLIRREAREAESVVVIGGGILGLEIAGALVGGPKKLTVLEGFDWLMPRQLNRKAAHLLQDHLRGLGVDLKTGVMVDELVGDERVAGVLLKNGETVPGDLVIIAAGVRSNSHLARTAGLRVNQGVIVNDFLQTSAPGV